MKEHADIVPIAANPHDSDEVSPPLPVAKLSNLSFLLTLVALSLSVFCVALDTVIVVTAIPRITDAFHSVNDIGWQETSSQDQLDAH